MKILAMVAMTAAMFGTSGCARSIQKAGWEITVCMDSTGDIAVKSRARAIASDIFSAIGVTIQWHDRHNCPQEGILIILSGETPATLMPGALAYAQPYEGTHVVLFYDRVKNRPSGVACVLGHVIAHEVTHVLQGVARHSESGVMKAQWTGADYRQMTWEPLRFTAEDVQLIENGLKAREAHLDVVPKPAANVPESAGW